ncbi:MULTISPECIES: beta-phosphoglucomutase family hydrolase [unclassified Streptomyces]|uniref:beta-phosphoglucomutase family hydrolase n=1 Tax=unclassified Streptomyces TaxID=2593676 RepID=UPI001F045D3A|nr:MULTISPECIES: beta-phosphoglucomutase family hydrolase [unclassified Streptomyces]MCH0566533.1 beta-phosphoglucomutase family hydrolase [Streptomyces sp. MUM 2J]MCH0571814.1 beta-phosphoglucomutase family hydrolase [Streptomyces sp. MUM 136J]
MTTELGLPDDIRACLFDLDGVVTRTATLHAAAWKETFDAFLEEREGATPLRPFDAADYDEYVDGRPRADGVRTFLCSRGIELPEGESDDPPDADTVHGLGNRKNALLLERIRTEGAEAYDGSVRYVVAARARGLATAVVSSSANTLDVLRSIGAEGLFDVRIDGVVAAERRLPGKPRPDTFLAAAADLGVPPARAAVFEDALAGMDAGRAGRFGYVVGVDRAGQRDALYAHGADRVVADLSELLSDRPRG